ncbi:MAG: voltage-gated chloride channel family protein [Halobacteriovorax sp.]|nr:voltage-gated chloride channel family protein [Halobacteriovorax sp.]
MKLHLKLGLSLFDGVLVGSLAGLASAAFLYALAFAASTFSGNSDLLYALPMAGAFTIFLYSQFGKLAAQGNHLVIDEINSPKKDIPIVMAPLIFLTTVLTHLFGGSAGREGTAVQMGASLAEAIAKRLSVDPARRRRLLIAGMGAGFGTAIGAPLAGALFGMEVLRIGKIKPIALLESLAAAASGYLIIHLTDAPHTIYPQVEFYFNPSLTFYIPLLAIVCALLARTFIASVHLLETKLPRLISSNYARVVIVSILLILLFKLEGSGQYNGLGLDIIVSAFDHNLHWSTPLLKIFFTVLTISIGFKGGEFTPLAFIGATAASVLALYLPVSTSLFVALGFASVFAAASKTPLACAIMAAELFGLQTLAPAIVCCYLATWLSGPKGIYRFQI